MICVYLVFFLGWVRVGGVAGFAFWFLAFAFLRGDAGVHALRLAPSRLPPLPPVLNLMYTL